MLRRERTEIVSSTRVSAPRRAPTRSNPSSPMREHHPLHWFVRDIDIGDTADTRSDSGGARYPGHVSSLPRDTRVTIMFRSRPHYMQPLQRTRSRHDCNFIPGTPFLNNGSYDQSYCHPEIFSFLNYFFLHDLNIFERNTSRHSSRPALETGHLSGPG